jgi:hypothetical protein
MGIPNDLAIADGIAVFWNNYDAQVYAIGKGPTQTTTYVQNDVVAFGSSVIIKGTVTDISAGTKQEEQAARFPNGVPCVNDASQAQWMEYVYMQKGLPSNSTGVDVTISVIDSNGNFRDIGKTKTMDGYFSLNWKPDITGAYTVYANFAGTESYWPSHAVTSFQVDAAAPTPTTGATAPPSMADQYLLPLGATIIVLIIVVGAVLALLLVRKRP